MTPRGSVAGRAASSACLHCGLPAKGEYCCSGCYLARRLTGGAPAGDADDAAPSSRLLARVVLSAFLATGVMVFSLALYAPWLEWGEAGEWDGEAAQAIQGLARLAALALSAPVLLLIGAPLAEAVVQLRRWLSADALVLAGTLAAWGVSVWNTFVGTGHVYYETATLVLVLVGLGRWMDVRARERARRAAEARVPERVRAAARVEHGTETLVPPEELVVGDRVRVRPGETMPVDGVVLEGRSFADAADLTGESEPRSLAPGDPVLAGVRLVDGSLLVRATAAAGARVRDEIERCLNEALRSRPASVRLADRLAGFLLPVALTVAAGSAAWRWSDVGPEKALLDALCVVLIACPCALGIATPLAFWVALEEAWKRGVLVRGGEVLERLARARRAFLDKTGTLTHAELTLVSIETRAGLSKREALRVCTALEAGSEHPIGAAVREAWREQGAGPLPKVSAFRTLPGLGVEARIDERVARPEHAEPGTLWQLVRAPQAAPDASASAGGADAHTRTQLVRGDEPVAQLAFLARARPEARAVVRALERLGLAPTVLTGDGPGPAGALARELDVTVHAELLPADKVRAVRSEPRSLFVGDGLNDAAALAAADVGVSVARGSARALDAAAVNLLTPGLEELPGLVELARRAVRTARINLAWAVTYNALGIALAATGRLTPIFAAAAMVLSSAAVVLHSSRLARDASRPARAPGAPAEATDAPTAALSPRPRPSLG